MELWNLFILNLKIRQMEMKTFTFLSYKPVDPGLLT